MDRRLQLDKELRDILQAALGYVHLYFQPPASVRMEYDAMRYKKTGMDVCHADNQSYIIREEYQVIFITRDPDSPVPRMIQEHFAQCRPEKSYVADDLYHHPFTIYY